MTTPVLGQQWSDSIVNIGEVIVAPPGTLLFTCWNCGFAFDAIHYEKPLENEGSITCPLCEIEDLKRRIVAKEALL